MSEPDPKTPAAAFLAGLSSDGFLPPESRVVELNADAGLNLPVSSAALDERTAKIGDDVAAFAAAFWDMPPADRRARWEELAALKPAWPISTRLDALASGLDVASWPHPDPTANELATLIRELFVLPPRARAVRRAEWLMEYGGKRSEWNAIAIQLQADQPNLVALEPTHFRWFTHEVAVPSPVWADPAFKVTSRDERKRIRQQNHELKSYAVSRNGFGCGGILVIIVVLRIIVAVFSSSSRTQPTNAYPNYKYEIPAQTSRPEGKFTKAEVEAFWSYEFRKNTGGGVQSQPSRYAEWVRFDRPDGTLPSR